MFLRPFLWLHSACYRWISRFAIAANNGVHPKHSILNYEKWFCDNVKSGWCVLDIGCNTGILANKISPKASFVYAVDIDRNLIQKAHENNSADNIEYICADINSFDCRTEKAIDCIVMSNLLEHIEDRIALLKRLVHNVNWTEKTKKVFLIRVPALQRDWITVYKKNLGSEYRLDKTHFIEYTNDEFVSELAQAKITIVKMEIRFGEIYAVCQCL
ncbi:MAG: class I SAM-dependent methyltransferase [Sedimentisphaerales bacterium]|nr:class I SAM-dependent methyltransferase [Sedimentisphaerales bacterium]